MTLRVYLSTIALTCALLVTPFVARAQTADQLRAQIAQILAQINSLRAQLQPTTQPVAPVATTPATPPTTIATVSGAETFQYSGCPNLQYNLQRNDRDFEVAEEVTMLQNFLRQDSQLYPEDEVTGYFGPATERAVQRFQARHGIVFNGDPASTGYGRLGPRTRHAIKNSCGVGVVTNAHDFSVSPLSGAAPLIVRGVFEYRGSSCTSYQIDWGDGSAPVSYQAPTGSGCTQDTVRKEATHTYTRAGTYVVTLRTGQGSVHALPIVGRATVVVGGSTSTSASQSYLFVSNSQGNAPLPIQARVQASTPRSCTSYSIDWGDGSAPIIYNAGNTGCGGTTFTETFAHTYTTAGTYTLRVRAGQGALAGLSVMEQQIRVGAGVSVSPAVTGGCFIEPNNGIAPLSSRARLLLGGSLCDGNLKYSIDWGDGSVSETRTCADRNEHYAQFDHVYSTPGTYTARLLQSHPQARFQEYTCAVSVIEDTSTTQVVNPISTLCQQWTDGCNTCSRAYYGGPTRCTQRYCIQAGTQQCYQYFTPAQPTPPKVFTRDTLESRLISRSNRTVEFSLYINADRSCNGGVYTLHFGDAQSSVQPFAADACQQFTRTVSHTYAQPGNYTAFLIKDGIVVDQLQVNLTSVSGVAAQNLAAVVTVVEDLIRSIFK